MKNGAKCYALWSNFNAADYIWPKAARRTQRSDKRNVSKELKEGLSRESVCVCTILRWPCNRCIYVEMIFLLFLFIATFNRRATTKQLAYLAASVFFWIKRTYKCVCGTDGAPFYLQREHRINEKSMESNQFHKHLIQIY